MSDALTLELHGFKELGDQLAQFPAKLARRGLARAVSDGAAIVVRKAKEKAAAIGLQDEGTLIKSITRKKLKIRDWRTTVRYGIYHSKSVYMKYKVSHKTKEKYIGVYGAYYEKGFDKSAKAVSRRGGRTWTSGNRTQRPHLRPAIDENIPAIVEAIKQRLAKEIHEMMPHLVRRF